MARGASTESKSTTNGVSKHGANGTNGANGVAGARRNGKGGAQESTWLVKKGLAQMLKGGVIMDVVTEEHAKIAEDAGACAVMALERVPADIRAAGGVARMSDPELINRIIESVTIPVMAKARIGHFVEAQVLEALGVDYIDESEVLTPADEEFHIDKHQFKVPFVCGCRDLGEALRRIGEGAAMIRTKGEAGTGNVVEAVRHARTVLGEIRKIQHMPEEELMSEAKRLGAPYDLVKQIHETGQLPVVNFAAGGIATPADAALLMQIGVDGVFVGSGIFKSDNPAKRAKAIVQATTHFRDPKIIAEVSRGIGEAMRGLEVATMPAAERLAVRGW
jgi:pyridoxal 5'-phosphate synthase pdxS subunit